MRNRPPTVTRRFRPRVEALETREVLSTAYLATDLVSDQPGVAALQDPNLVNAWGISLSPTAGAFWVSSAGKGVSTLYTGDVTTAGITRPLAIATLVVSIPGGAPTGQVFNTTTDFTLPTPAGGRVPAIFIFASESGNITAWNPGAPPATSARLVASVPDAIYKGLALASNASGNFLYAANFHEGTIDTFDKDFQLSQLDGTFTDPNLPEGYAPFNIQNLGGKLYVTYARQDADGVDDVAGRGRGFVNVFDTDGHLLERLASRGRLNSPWGLALAPDGFGDFSGALLVGNFGDGRINAYDPDTGRFLGQLSSSRGHPLVIDGLWGLAFGNGVSAGDRTTLYYAAGPDDETHGLFGKITANPEGTNPVKAVLTGTTLTITGSRDNDHVHVQLQRRGQEVVVRAGGDVLGRFDAAALSSIQFKGFAGNDHIVIDQGITVNAVLDGGAGRDVLISGSGNDILLGGPDEDLLVSHRGRDVLIGGEDSDALLGGFGDDILIGGTTAHDSNLAALQQILARWTAADSYNDRVAAIRSGTGGVPKLDSTTVPDDGVADLLFGGLGLDWFFSAPPDLLLGRVAAEQVN